MLSHYVHDLQYDTQLLREDEIHRILATHEKLWKWVQEAIQFFKAQRNTRNVGGREKKLNLLKLRLIQVNWDPILIKHHSLISEWNDETGQKPWKVDIETPVWDGLHINPIHIVQGLNSFRTLVYTAEQQLLQSKKA